MTTGEKIKRLRKENGFTQEQLAELINVSLMSVRRWEWGKTAPNSKYLQKLAEVLNTTSEYLLENENNDDDFIMTATSVEKTIKNDGMATIALGNGKNVTVPATPEGYAFLEKIFMASLNGTPQGATA